MTIDTTNNPNNKPIVSEDGLAIALDEMARDIALIEPDPQDWGWWVSYLLEQMEGEPERRGIRAKFEEMLESLKKHLGNRGWA